MITTLIVDDEPQARELLRGMIQKFLGDELFVIDDVDNVDGAVKVINEHRPELVFLDIQMPGKKGFELFNAFNTVFFDVIFTTAYDEYAIQAIKHSAVDYIMKPITPPDLFECIKRLKRKTNAVSNHTRIMNFLNQVDLNANQFNRVALPTENGFTLVKLNQIVYAEADGNYCRVHTLDNKNVLISKTLKHLEELLPSDVFFRIHKSYLINLNYLDAFSRKEQNEVCMNNGVKLPVSFRKKESFIAAITRKNTEA